MPWNYVLPLQSGRLQQSGRLRRSGGLRQSESNNGSCSWQRFSCVRRRWCV